MGLHRERNPLVLLWVIVLLWSGGCGALETQPPTATSSATPMPATATARATSTPRPTATAAPPTPTPTPAILSPSQIFDRVAPSIAYIETPLGSGSGILVEGNYLITNAHVVWPYTDVRVVFPDGSEFEEVPLVNWDGMIDLAVLGPLEEVAAAPLALVDGEASVVGSDVYLVGYPGEVESLPQPTITRGLISRMRQWELGEVTYFQTDAVIAGGQSGGALVSERGDVIGVSGFAFAGLEFALVASAADLEETIERLETGRRVPDPGSHAITRGSGETNHIVLLRHDYDLAVFLVGAGCGPALEVEAESEIDIVLQFYDLLTQELQEVDEAFAPGVERLAVPVVAGRPYMVAVYALNPETRDVRIESSCNLINIEDRDDWERMRVGETVQAAIDFSGDADLFYLDMEEGEVVNFLVDSTSINPYLAVTYPGAGSDDWVEDDDSGGGLWGLNAELAFRAPHSGRFWVMVSDLTGIDIGGYSLSVSEHGSGGPTPVAMAPTATPIASEFGPMQLYRGRLNNYEMELPASWEDVSGVDPSCQGTCYDGGDGFLIVVEEDVEAHLGEAGRSMTREQYVTLVLQNFATLVPGAVLQSRQSLTTANGLPVDIVHYLLSEGGDTLQVKSLITFQDGIGFNALYLAPDATYAELAPMIDYSFSTLRIVE